jgi:hypothetical protein
MTSQRSKKGRISAALFVKLPGIEPGTKIALSCGNTEFRYAKVRETTCGYARRVDGINMHNAPVVRWSVFPSESIAGRTIDGGPAANRPS